MTHSQLSYLTDSACHRVLMAAYAGLSVVQRTQPIVDAILFFEMRLVIPKRVAGGFGKAITDALRSRVVIEGWSAESGGGLRASLAQHMCNGA